MLLTACVQVTGSHHRPKRKHLLQVIGGKWPEPPFLHMNCFELSMVLKALKLCSVVDRQACDNKDRQQKSRSLHKLPEQRLFGSAIGTDKEPLVVTQGFAVHQMALRPDRGSWVPHLFRQMGQVRSIGGLFTSNENARCALLFSMGPQDFPPLVMDTISHLPWPRVLLYTCPRVILIPR